ncbi:acyl-CoA dehydrogenase [Microcella humidisoli]|uniref:Acyl-CoA dehydrogenase n=1 Tax=Microcella humidisoli TaxID=2963406 RepID=A0ABY5FZQ5_9MICO|nr:acyl-CoA dehydrogenase [Microcella humidisoli]UTT63607.1 acyl-CoA dehydrogenase [Microcella humidisoli]
MPSLPDTALLAPVSLAPAMFDPGPLTAIVLRHAPQGVDESLRLARQLGETIPAVVPNLLDQWEALATLAAHDVGVARIVEPHLDALSMLRDARVKTHEGDAVTALTWGVFAAEGGDEPLTAIESSGTATLSGVKPWCSLASRLDAALVTAHVDGDDRRSLFAARLGPRVEIDDEVWVARGLAEIPSGPVRFTGVAAVRVGEPGWYLDRTEFWWGGVGVAACWFGGAIGIARALHAAAAAAPNPHLLAHLGAIDEVLQAARRALAEAAEITVLANADPRLTAKRVRATVARACDEVIDRAHRALGPAPLALDGAHAKRVADLQLYVRQHHAERDQASLGAALAEEPAPW